MRRFTVLSGVIVLLLFFGCRENLVDPAETVIYETNKGYLTEGGMTDVTQVIKDEIPICCAANDPATGHCNLKGKVTYMHEILDYIADSIKVKINLEMDAELCTKLMHFKRCQIYGNTEDIVFIKVNGKILFDKSYRIDFRPDIRLCVQYLITTQKISIMQMNLLQVVDPGSK